MTIMRIIGMVITILLICYFIFLIIRNNRNIKNDNKKVYLIRSCSESPISGSIFTLLPEIVEISFEQAQNLDNTSKIIIYPCGYTYLSKNISNEIKAMNSIFVKNRNNNAFYMGINNIDELVGKDSLWRNVSSYYSREETLTYFPETFLLPNETDKLVKSLNESKNEGKLLFFKNNLQRKQGIKTVYNIEKNKEDIISYIKSGKFKVCQYAVENIYKVDSHVMSLRIYLLIKRVNNVSTFYRHSIIKCMYGSSRNDLITCSNPNTLRKMFIKFPMTLNLLFSEEENIKIEREINDSLIFLLKSYEDILYINNNNNHSKETNQFQILGIDAVLMENLKVKIIEINKGPSLIPINYRDFLIKRQVVLNFLQVIFEKSSTKHDNCIQLM